MPRKLGRTKDVKTAMLRAMVTYLIENGKIETTVTRAKEVRPLVEKMITLGKTNTLASKRQALAFITKEDAGSGTATLIEGAIPANTPVTLQAEAGKYIMPIAAVDVEVPDVSANLLEGTGEEGKEVTAGSVWVVADRDGTPVLRKISDMTLPARKAYLPYVEFGSDAPSKAIIFDVTGVKGVKTAAKSGKAYDLQGRRVSDNAKGIVIVNGKKVRR